MKEIPLKEVGPLFLAVTALSLILVQSLRAVEETPATQGKQEESFFQGIKRNLGEWLGRDSSADKAKEKTSGQTEEKTQNPATKKSDGRKTIDTFKKEMNKISNNISESVERDKKNLKKKFDKLRDKN